MTNLSDLSKNSYDLRNFFLIIHFFFVPLCLCERNIEKCIRQDTRYGVIISLKVKVNTLVTVTVF